MESINRFQSYQVPFSARFLHSESLKQVVEYACAHGQQFDKLNIARKNIDKSYKKVLLKVDISVNDKKIPTLNITRYVPKRGINFPQSMDDYELIKTISYWSYKPQNPLKFALHKLIKLGNNAPHNNMFRKVIAEF